MEAVKQDGRALRYASEELRRDTEFILEVVKQHFYAPRYASEELKRDREALMEAVKPLKKHSTNDDRR
jgi:hypothetical protein